MPGKEGQKRRLGGTTIGQIDLLHYILTLRDSQDSHGKLKPFERYNLVNRGFEKTPDHKVIFTDEKIAEVVDMPIGRVRTLKKQFEEMNKFK